MLNRIVGGSLLVVAVVSVAGCSSKETQTPRPPVADGGSGNRVPPSTGSTGGGDKEVLPQHFAIDSELFAYDCRTSGETVTCVQRMATLTDGIDSWTGTLTGTLSGSTMTGVATSHQTGHAPADPGCTDATDGSWPVTYDFSADGTVTMHMGPFRWDYTGSCITPHSSTGKAVEATGRWSPSE